MLYERGQDVRQECRMASKLSAELHWVEAEGTLAGSSRGRRGGWITIPFILGSGMGMSVATFGATSNLIVYLIEEYNIKSIDAAQIFNIINGCINLAPIVGAVISDSFFGCFAVVAASSVLSFLGTALFTSTATAGALRPPPCQPASSAACREPSAGQNALLYMAVTLLCMGAGGTGFNMATMGANQFDRPADQGTFFNWYFFVMNVGAIIGSTVVVYVQDNVSWGWGFGACAATSAAGVTALLLGARYYRSAVPEMSPLLGLARVLVAAGRKWRTPAMAESTEYYYGGSGEGKPKLQSPTPSFRFLNRAATKREGEVNPDGSVAKPWSLCSVDQVEDLKAVLRILPLWSTSILLSTSIGVLLSLTVLQALSLDRHLGPRFSLPAGSLVVSSLSATAVCIVLLDRCFYPAWLKLLGRPLTPLQRVGIGHVINAAAMATAALVERRCVAVAQSLDLVHRPGAILPITVLWLLPPLLVVGMGDAFHFPGQVALYYQEFPESLRSSATGMMGLVIAVGFYLSTAVVDLVRRATDWLPDNINAARLDRFYWTLAAIGVINLGYFILCARRYKYRDSVVSSTAPAANADE